MTLDLFNDPTSQGLTYALNSLSLRQAVLANNIANVQTPGFEAQDVSFESQLSDIFAGQQETSSPLATGTVVDAPDITTRTDGNTVSVESEMGKMAETTLLYQALSQLTADRLGILKTAITG
jgi:flagellar basal-body rod protein FlgB